MKYLPLDWLMLCYKLLIHAIGSTESFDKQIIFDWSKW